MGDQTPSFWSSFSVAKCFGSPYPGGGAALATPTSSPDSCIRSRIAVRNFTARSIKAPISCWLALRRDALVLVGLAWPVVLVFPLSLVGFVVDSVTGDSLLGVVVWVMGAARSPCGDSMRTTLSLGLMAESPSNGIHTYLRSNPGKQGGFLAVEAEGPRGRASRR